MSNAIEELHIRNALIDNYDQYAEGLDSKIWDKVRACFADEVYIDYGAISAPTGDPKIPRKTDDWLQILQGVINGFDVTRHTITNHRVIISEQEVSCRAYLTADHVIFEDPEVPIVTPNDVVTVVGEYKNYYQQDSGSGAWKIQKSTLKVEWSSGNMELFARGIARLAEAN